MNSVISQLMLQHFRSYSHLQLHFSKPFVVLYGANGAGKTNILEAISLFTPGKGMRRSDFKDMHQQNAPAPWAVSLKVNEHTLGTGITTLDAKKRHWFLNQEPMKGQKTLYDLMRLFWLTPETDRLFLDSPSTRRQFIDRMIFVLKPEYSQTVKRYEQAVKERLKLLVDNGDKHWIAQLETQIAEYGLKIIKERQEFIKNLPFDSVLSASMEGNAESITTTSEYANQLENNQPRDAAAGMTFFGPHRSDLCVVYKTKNQQAANCSTGEQKLLLAKIIIAFLKYLKIHLHVPLVLLFDDVISHLDFSNRVLLFEQLLTLQQESTLLSMIQVFFTATEDKPFAPIADYADFYSIENSEIRTKTL